MSIKFNMNKLRRGLLLKIPDISVISVISIVIVLSLLSISGMQHLSTESAVIMGKTKLAGDLMSIYA